MAVANIMPGDTITMALDYSEFLVPADGVYSFVYPAVVGPRCSDIPESEADRWIQSPYLPEGAAAAADFDFTAEIAGAMPLKKIQSPSHSISIAWQNAANARVSLSPSAVFGGSRDMILNYRLAGLQIESGLLLYDGAAENFFALMVEPPKRFSPDAVPAREYMFVVDVSGSMHGFPLDTAKTLLKNLLTGLRPQDRFNVMLFAASARKMAPAPVAAAPARVQQALRLIDRQQGGGGTNLAGAMAKALAPSGDAGFSRSIVIVTDGYIAAEKEVFSLISDNLNAANVFAFGIGGSVNRYLIEGMAKAGQGEPFVVTEAAAGPAAAERFRKYVASPLLTDIMVDWEGFAAYAVEPPAIPDLFAGRPVVVFGKWRGTAEGRIRLRGKTGRGAYERVLDVSKTPPQAANRPLRYLWARKRSARLSDYNTKNAGRANKAAVTKLGLAYNLLTPYTAFVAVHERVRNPGGHAADVDQPLPLPRGVSHLAVGEPVGQALARVPEPAIWQVLAGAALLIFGAGLYLVTLYLYFYLLQCLLRICAGLRQGRTKDAASAQAWL